MIEHIELKNLATFWHIDEAVVEKDYVIGWILCGISSNPFFAKHL